jgi:bifunctional DNA-binding transcriptional regulator/antitoxin component of YhaV-PrlF toxin-antitoxin module
MEAVIDSTGRILVPKALRLAYGLLPGAKVDISGYGTGVQITPGGRTAKLVHDADGRLVAAGDGSLDDLSLFALIDSGRR